MGDGPGLNSWHQVWTRALKRRRNTLAALAAVVVALGGSTMAVADSLAPATAATVIYACVNGTTKAMTQSTATATCPTGATKIHWNVTGPPGPKGAPGATGPPGLAVGYFGSHTGSYVSLSGSNPSNQILVVSTPAVTHTGTYFISASALLGESPDGAYCGVGTDNSGAAVDGLSGGGNSGANLGQAAVTDSIQIPAGDAAALWCYDDFGDVQYVYNAALTATLMTSVNT